MTQVYEVVQNYLDFDYDGHCSGTDQTRISLHSTEEGATRKLQALVKDAVDNMILQKDMLVQCYGEESFSTNLSELESNLLEEDQPLYEINILTLEE